MSLGCIAFFGDSWVAGCEANEVDGSDSPDFAFPSFFEQSINLGITGSSNDSMIYQLSQNLDNIDTAIFCLTDPARRYFVSEDLIINGNLHNLQIESSAARNYRRSLVNLSNDVNDDLLTSNTCLLLYLMCFKHNIRCYFVNLFGGQHATSALWKLIPKELWLLPIHTCIAKELFDTTGWYPDQPLIGDFTDWLNNDNLDVKKFIRPCEAHPNKTGHRLIADFIIERIKNDTGT